MPKQTFGSFKELLIKKDLSGGESDLNVKVDVLVRIFRFVQPEIVLNNVQHFPEADIKVIKALLSKPEIRDGSAKNVNSQAEKLIRDGLLNLSEKSKGLLCELLGEESKSAQSDAKRLESLAEKFHPKDATEEHEELKRRIQELKADIVDIEMSLMTLESDDSAQSERYKKASNARERRRQLLKRLEKQLEGVAKKLSKDKVEKKES
jgi:septal ring factor EnvC (AmiA/AmiB activator)